MAYDEGLAERVREQLAGEPGLTEKKMFGGLCVLVRGNMACGVIGAELMVRVGKGGYEAALALPHAREMDFTGKPLKTMVYVSADGITRDEDLSAWVERGAAHARSLPPK